MICFGRASDAQIVDGPSLVVLDATKFEEEAMGVPEDNITLTKDSTEVTGPGTSKLVQNNMLIVQSADCKAIRVLSIDHEAKTAQLTEPWPTTSGTFEYPDWDTVPLRNKNGQRWRSKVKTEKPAPGS